VTAGNVRRPGALSIAIIWASVGTSVVVSLAMDALLLGSSSFTPVEIIISACLFNVTVVVQSVVGAVIEWRRSGHSIGRLLLLSGPLYAFLALAWLTGSSLQGRVDPDVSIGLNWAGTILSWPGVAVIVGWIPLLFPTGSLPSARWRVPAGLLVIVSGIGLAALAVRPGPLGDGTGHDNPIGIEGWPSFLGAFVDAIPLELVGLIVLAIAALVIRYRRGDRVERLQIRWFTGAVALCAFGFAGTAVQAALRTESGPLSMTIVGYAGILAMPIAIGVAVTRYHLYEIDRIISRTISYGLVTVTLVAVYAGLILLLQAPLGPVTGGGTIAVAASTLVAAGLFQPVRRRIQGAVDRRFNRARYDAERTAAAFATELRDEANPAEAQSALLAAVTSAIAPQGAAVWIRGESR
jgi:hypothetical protein